MKNSEFNFGTVSFRPKDNLLIKAGETSQLDPKASQLLSYFIDNKNTVISRKQLMDEVWHNVVVNDNTINWHIAQLRKALGDNAKNPTYIKTLPKLGYQFHLEESEITNARIGKKSGLTYNQPWRYFSIALVLAVSALLFFGTGEKQSKKYANTLLLLPDVSSESEKSDPEIVVYNHLLNNVAKSLSENPDTALISMKSARQFNPEASTPLAFANAVKADYWIESRFNSEPIDNQVLIKAEISIHSTSDGRLLIKKHISVSKNRIMDLQTQIINLIKGEFNLQKVTNANSMLSLETYELRALAEMNQTKRTPDSLNRALNYYQQIIQSDPNLAAVYADQVTTFAMLYEAGAISFEDLNQKAQPLLEIALSLDKQSADVRMAKANFLFITRQLSEAESELTTLIQQFPNFVTPYLLLGNLNRNRGGLLAARQLYDKAFELDPLNRGITSILGTLLMLGGDYLESDKVLRLKYETTGEVCANAIILSELHAANGNLPESAKWLDLYSVRVGNDLFAQNARARLFYVMSEYHLAFEQLHKIQQVSPGSYPAFQDAMLFHLWLQDWEKYLETLKTFFPQVNDWENWQALASNTDLRLWLAYYWANNNQYDKAIHSLEIILKDKSSSFLFNPMVRADILALLIYSYQKSGIPEKAESLLLERNSVLQKGIEEGYRTLWIYANMAGQSAMEGNVEEAMSMLQLIIDNGYMALPYLNYHPQFTSLRERSDFQLMVKELEIKVQRAADTVISDWALGNNKVDKL